MQTTKSLTAQERKKLALERKAQAVREAADQKKRRQEERLANIKVCRLSSFISKKVGVHKVLYSFTSRRKRQRSERR